MIANKSKGDVFCLKKPNWEAITQEVCRRAGKKVTRGYVYNVGIGLHNTRISIFVKDILQENGFPFPYKFSPAAQPDGGSEGGSRGTPGSVSAPADHGASPGQNSFPDSAPLTAPSETTPSVGARSSESGEP